MLRLFVATLLCLLAAAAGAAPAAAAANASGPCPGGTSARQLAAVIAHHLAAARTCYQAGRGRCTDFTARRCERAVKRYRGQLRAAQRDLAGASVPARLERPYRATRRGLSTALRATRKALRAIRAEDFGDWVDAHVMHARAAERLKRAAALLARAVD